MEMQLSPAANCRTLAEYRIDVLGLKQRDIADRAKCKQPWISHIERGQLPKPWNRGAVLRAYSLERWEADFVRMVTAARIEGVMSKPASETEPLFAAQAGVPVIVSLPTLPIVQKAGLA